MRPDLADAREREVARLDAEILEAIGRGWDDPLGEEEFDRLARDVFAHQFRFNPVYRQFCLLQGASAPADVERWQAIPPVPTGAFKVGRWATFPPDDDRAAFRTSGTTCNERGVHHLDTLALYNAAIVSSARRYLVPDRERIRCLFLSPEPRLARDSSLVHMFAVFREAMGAPGTAFLLAADRDRGAEALAAALDCATDDGEPVLLAGAALAFNHALAGSDRTWRLPSGSRAMVTGGFKGLRARADPAELGRSIEEKLGIPRELQASEYGMTELSTQYYDAGLRRALGCKDPARGLVVPPWARVRIVEPGELYESPPGEVGAIVHYDLANRGSALAIQTSDLGARTGPDAFELRGREPGAEARGCSLAADLWLGGA
ncbi:coenzyme F390 synthetase [soil metagenome]